MRAERRISATFKDLPGGQILGPTFDYTHRLLDFTLLAGDNAPTAEAADEPLPADMPRVVDILGHEGLIEADSAAPGGEAVGDLTREPLAFPAGRDLRLQNLARGDEGFVLALAYSSQRGFGNTHPFAGEIRIGEVEIEIEPDDLGFPVTIGRIAVTECQMVSQFKGSKTRPPQFTRGYGLAFGHNERKAMAMAIVDRALRADEFDEERRFPAQDEEFVLNHSDNVEASGFLQHLKLPHYVDFQGELVNLRALRAAQTVREEETAS
jgi:alpha-D-ribose 1-methylphosphonate 5-triphosphate synthase subunit PhnI